MKRLSLKYNLVFLLLSTVITYHSSSLSSEYSGYYGWTTHTGGTSSSSSSSSSSGSGGPFRQPREPYRPAPYRPAIGTRQQPLQIPLPLLQPQEQTLQLQQEAQRRFLQELQQQQARQATTTTTGQVAHPGIIRAQEVPYYAPGRRTLPERLPEPKRAPSQYGRLSQIMEPGTLVHTTTTRTTRTEEALLPTRVVGPFLYERAQALDELRKIIESHTTARLDLSNNALGDEGLAYLANSNLASHITYLNIANIGLTRHGIQLLKKFTALTHLDISRNRLEDDDLNILVNTLNPEQIISLNLNSNFITIIGLQALAHKLRNLRELSLEQNIIASPDLLVLAPLATNLRFLNVQNTPVPKSKLEELKKLFPQAQIII